MSSKAMSLKGRIKNYAKSNNIAAQVVLQNYMFERFLERLSISEYSEKFVVKGGMLIAAIVGLDTRSTMDLDTTLRNLPLTEEQISAALSSICTIDLKDDVSFEIKSVAPIRKEDVYGGYCVRLDAIYDTIITPLSIDVSTGDIITPAAVKYEFGGIFDEEVFTEALKATAIHRGSLEKIVDVNGIIEQISSNEDLKNMWGKYQKKFAYAKEITFDKILGVLNNLFA